MRVYVVSARRRALSSETSESSPTITVLRAGPADSVDTNISTPDPSACMGVMTRRSASSMVRPVMVCRDAIALRTPSLTPLNGASAVDVAELDARNRYSPSTTSKSTARVFAPPISTARRESPCVREEGINHLTKSEESPKEMQAFDQCSQRSRIDSGKQNAERDGQENTAHKSNELDETKTANRAVWSRARAEVEINQSSDNAAQ